MFLRISLICERVSLPQIEMCPEVGKSVPVSIEMVVVLPVVGQRGKRERVMQPDMNLDSG